MSALLDELGRPKIFKMPIQGSMLEALGINMYTSVGKCLVEFGANSYDSDADWINISLPFDEIESARADIRAKAKADVKDAFWGQMAYSDVA